MCYAVAGDFIQPLAAEITYVGLFFGLRSVNRTYACTSAAFKTFVSVDNVLAVLFGNSFYRTFGSASAAADAIVRNFVCHFNKPPCLRYAYSNTYSGQIK